jgi:hypothetical protein
MGPRFELLGALGEAASPPGLEVLKCYEFSNGICESRITPCASN